MEIRLYKQFVKRINSTLQPTGTYDTKTVTLKEKTSVMTPTFILTSYDPSYNYVYVPSWGRYYFVSDCSLNINGLFELSCNCDILATYRDSIRNYTCFVERTSDSAKYDIHIHDGSISALDRIISTESSETDCFPSATVYILRVLGRNASKGIGTFVLTGTQLNSIFSGVWGDVDDDTITDQIKALLNLYINDPSQYIVGVYRSPIGITKYLEYGTDEVTIYVGGHETNMEALRVDTPDAVIFGGRVLSKPINMYGDFRAYDPAFSEYTLYIPTIGVIPLPAEIMHMELKVTLCADLYSGDLTFILYADNDIVASFTSNCYASVSVGVQNGSSGASLMTTGLGIAGGIASGNIGLAGSGIVNGIQKIISPVCSVLGTQGSIGAVTTYPKFVITCKQKSSSDAPTGVYGKPCCKNLQLSTVSGYVKCANASINDIAGTDKDKEQINAFLNGGFYNE